MSDALSQIQVAADRVRGEFFGTLRELDRRRRAAMDIRRQIREHAGILVVGGLVLASGILIVSTLAIARNKSRPSRLRKQGLDGISRAGKRPERLPDQWDPLVAAAGKIFGAVGAAVGSRLIKRKAQSIARSPGTRP